MPITAGPEFLIDIADGWAHRVETRLVEVTIPDGRAVHPVAYERTPCGRSTAGGRQVYFGEGHPSCLDCAFAKRLP